MAATLGPWGIEGPDPFGDFNILPASKTLAIAAVVSNLRNPKEVEANARLIAAAPDMLAALRNAVDAIEFCLNEHVPQDCIFRTKITKNLTAARAALASAEPA